MRGRLTRSVVDPAALLRNAKPLTGRDRETKKKKKRKKKSSKGCAEPGFRKPANFLGETAFFLENGLLVQFLRGGPGGRRQRRDVSRRGSKTPKTGEKCSVLGLLPVNSHIKLRFLLTRRSGRTLRTFFTTLESAFFRSDAAKKEFARKPSFKKAYLSESRNMLKMCISRAFFAPISKSKGSKTPKTGEKCTVLRGRPVNSHMKLQFLLIRRSGRTPRTLFPPLESAIFRSDVAKTSLWKIHKNAHPEKALFEPNAKQSEGFLAATSRSRSLKNR